MGLFSRKKKEVAPVAQAESQKPVVQNAYPPKKVSSATVTQLEVDRTTKVSEMSKAELAFKETEKKIYNGPKSIKPSVVEKCYAEMEIQLSARQPDADYHAYDVNPISMAELNKANVGFEKQLEELKQHQSKIRWKRFGEVASDNLEERLAELAKMYDYLTTEQKEFIDYGFYEISESELEEHKKHFNIDVAAKREHVINKIPKLNEKQLERIEQFLASDIRAKSLDFDNTIPELSPKMINKFNRLFEEKYGDRKAEIQESKKSENNEKLVEGEEIVESDVVKEFTSQGPISLINEYEIKNTPPDSTIQLAVELQVAETNKPEEKIKLIDDDVPANENNNPIEDTKPSDDDIMVSEGSKTDDANKSSEDCKTVDDSQNIEDNSTDKDDDSAESEPDNEAQKPKAPAPRKITPPQKKKKKKKRR